MLVQLLSYFGDLHTRMAVWNYKLDRVYEKLALVGFMSPTPPTEHISVNSNGDKIRVRLHEIGSAGIYSAMALIEFEGITPERIDFRLTQTSDAMEYFFHELAVRKIWVEEEYKHAKYTKSDKISEMFNRMTADLSFKGVLLAASGAYPNIYDMLDDVMPPKKFLDYNNSRFVNTIDLAREFVMHKPVRFKFAKRFYFSPITMNPHPEYFRRAWVVPPKVPLLKTVSFEEFLLLVQSEDLSKLIENSRAQGKAILFNFPITIDFQVITDGVVPDIPPITFNPNADGVKVSKITFWYEFLDTYRREHSNQFALLRSPEWVIEESPFVFNKQLEYGNRVHDVEGFRRGFAQFPDEGFVFAQRF
jgi:hypothetical protein